LRRRLGDLTQLRLEGGLVLIVADVAGEIAELIRLNRVTH